MNNLEDTLKIAAQQEQAGSKVLAEAIASALNQSRWVSSNIKIRLCILFMQSILESKMEFTDNIALIGKINKKPINFLVRFLKRYPDRGLHILSQSIMEELREKQKFKLEQLVEFHTLLLDLLFPPQAN